MKTDMILAGVGGQGILSIAAALGSAALTNNLYMKQAETHGMSQRGGDVQSYMRISDKPIFSDLIAKGTADIILSVEPMEALRYLPFLREGGYVVTNSPAGTAPPRDYRCRHHCQGQGRQRPCQQLCHAGRSFPLHRDTV